jgi:hypothetical protein
MHCAACQVGRDMIKVQGVLLTMHMSLGCRSSSTSLLQ